LTARTKLKHRRGARRTTTAAFLAAAAALACAALAGARAAAPAPAKRTAAHGGVSLAYDTALASAVRGEVAAGGQCGKPGDVLPAHLAFTLEGYPKPHPAPFMRPPEIQVFPVAAYRRALAACEKEMARNIIRSSAPLSYVSDFDAHVRTLRALGADRPSPRRLDAWLRRRRVREYLKRRMPFLPMYDVSEALRAKVAYFDFGGGQGVRFVTQYDMEDTLVSNQALAYVFQGITDDGAYYVSAAFPIAAPFLPAEYSEEEARRRGLESPAMPGAALRRYRKYLAENARLLEALAPGKYRPGLGLLDDLVRSLAVDRAAMRASLSTK
jgi:hypothetical protein